MKKNTDDAVRIQLGKIAAEGVKWSLNSWGIHKKFFLAYSHNPSRLETDRESNLPRKNLIPERYNVGE